MAENEEFKSTDYPEKPMEKPMVHPERLYSVTAIIATR